MRNPTANPQIRSHCKGIFNRLASPSFCNSPDAPCSAHSGNRQNTGVFPKSPIFLPKPCDAAQRAQGAQRTDGANAPCDRLPCQYFYSLPNGKRTSRERFAITRAKFRRQGSASLKIRNGPKGAHGAGGDGAPTPMPRGIGFAKTRNTKKLPPRGDRPREIPHSEEIGAPAKKTNPERGSLLADLGIGRPAQQPPRWACLSIVGAPLPMGGGLMPHMQAALPPKPDGIRRGAESGRPASCRISIPAGPTTASSG